MEPLEIRSFIEGQIKFCKGILLKLESLKHEVENNLSEIQLMDDKLSQESYETIDQFIFPVGLLIGVNLKYVPSSEKCGKHIQCIFFLYNSPSVIYRIHDPFDIKSLRIRLTELNEGHEVCCLEAIPINKLPDYDESEISIPRSEFKDEC